MRPIDADALKKDLEENCVFVGFEELLNDIMEVIDAQPTADVRPNVRDRWYAIGNTGLASCGCGFITDRYSMYNYCPLCGAEMRGGEDGLD